MAKKSKSSYASGDDADWQDADDKADTSAAVADRGSKEGVGDEPDEPVDPEATSVYTVTTKDAIIDGVMYPIEGKEGDEAVEVELTAARAAELSAGGVGVVKKEEKVPS